MFKGRMSFTAQGVCHISSQRCESTRHVIAARTLVVMVTHSRWQYHRYWGWRRTVLKQPALGRTMNITKASGNSEVFTSFICRKIQPGKPVQLVQLWRGVKSSILARKRKRQDMKRGNSLVTASLLIPKNIALHNSRQAALTKRSHPKQHRISQAQRSTIDGSIWGNALCHNPVTERIERPRSGHRQRALRE